jgi:cell division protein FtsB
MDDNIAIFLVLIVSMAAAITLVLAAAWMRRTRPLAAIADGAGQVANLSAENEMLRDQVRTLERELLAVERIAADSSPLGRTADFTDANREGLRI